MHPCRSRGCKNIKGQSWRSIKNLPVQPAPGASGSSWPSWQFSLRSPTFTINILQPLDLQECTVPHLKYLIHICLELEAQGYGITFNMFYVGSKCPYFISYRGKWLYLFWHGVCSNRCCLLVDFQKFGMFETNKKSHLVFWVLFLQTKKQTQIAAVTKLHTLLLWNWNAFMNFGSASDTLLN